MHGSYEDDDRFYDDPYASTWATQAFGQTPNSASRRREYYHSRSHAYDEYSTSYDQAYDLYSPSSASPAHAQYRDNYGYGHSAHGDPYHYEPRASGSREHPQYYTSRHGTQHGHRRSYHTRRSPSYLSPTRARTPTPPLPSSLLESSSPPQKSIPLSPSDSYLQIVAEPSQVESMNVPRKLIVLDLNGTLLVRTGRSASGGRAIHPRPYMPSFRDYIFSPQTRAWLDTMIWSSAQPHNVDRMVHRCFFDARLGSPIIASRADEEQSEEDGGFGSDKWEGKLLAVWARDTLGLSHAQYGTKTQTTKDLDKLWSAFHDRQHGPRTTLLLDDSPAKARLQPYNHVCIHEYDEANRSQDVSLKLCALRRAVQDSQSRRHGRKKAEGAEPEQPLSPKALRRKEKEEYKMEERALAKARLASPNESQLSGGRSEREKFDGTLLAVIGILSALRTETDAAGWIRAGGLWAGHAPPFPPDLETGSVSVNIKKQATEQVRRAPSPTDAEIEEPGEPAAVTGELDADLDARATADERQHNEWKTHNHLKRQRTHEILEDGGQADLHTSSREAPTKRARLDGDAAGIIERLELKTPTSALFSEESLENPGIQPPLTTLSAPSTASPTELPTAATPPHAAVDAILAGDDGATLGAGDHDAAVATEHAVHSAANADAGWDTTSGGDEVDKVCKDPGKSTISGSHRPHIWYEDEHAFEYWVARGRETLRELGIEIRDGIAV